METIRNAASAVLGYSTPSSQSGVEPTAGETGAGTVDQPYDIGNVQDGKSAQEVSAIDGAHDESVQSGAEPVNGVKGAGTATSPYDTGNSEDQQLGGRSAQEIGKTTNTLATATKTHATGPKSNDETTDRVLETTELKPLEPATASDQVAAQESVLDTTAIKPLEPATSTTAAVTATTSNDVKPDPLVAAPRNVSTASTMSANTSRQTVDSSTATHPDATTAALAAGPSLSATPSRETPSSESGTPGSGRKKIAEKMDKIKGKLFNRSK